MTTPPGGNGAEERTPGAAATGDRGPGGRHTAAGSPRVKICGLTRAEDAEAAAAAEADYLGVVVSGGFVRSVTADAAAALLAETGVPRVAVTVDESADELARVADTIDASVVQLHGSESCGTVEALRKLGPWRVWKAIRARREGDVRRAVLEFGDLVDGFVVEGWRPGVVGGGGAALELEPDSVRRTLVRAPDFILAGGLSHENVASAVARYRPDVVDVSSGVEETRGRKNADLVRAFVRAARAAGALD